MKRLLKLPIKLINNFLGLLARLLDDILLVLGIILISFGMYEIYHPLGYITIGSCLIAAAYFFAMKSR